MSFARIAERILQLIPVLFGVSVIVFLMISLTPGDPVEIMLGPASVLGRAAPAHRHRAR